MALIQSLSRGLEILDFMAERGGEASVTEAARFLGVDRSTGSRLLATLEGHGFVEQDSANHRYRLGSKLLQLSKTLLGSMSLTAAGHDEVRILADRTGEASHLAIQVGSDAVFIDQFVGSRALTINTSIGDHDPLYCTAIGRALLAGLSDTEVRDILGRVDMIAYTRKTTSSIDQVLERLRIVRLRGYAFDDEERYVGVQCVAAPVRDHTGRVVAAIGISAPSARVIRAGEAVIARAVLEAGRSVSSRLGYVSV